MDGTGTNKGPLGDDETHLHSGGAPGTPVDEARTHGSADAPREGLDHQLPALALPYVNDAVIAVDSTGSITYLNAAAEQRYDTRAGEAIGRPVAELFTVQWLDPADEAGARTALAEHGVWQGEHVHRRRDGSTAHVHSSVTVQQDASGAVIGLVGVIHDVMATRGPEAERRDHERQKDEFLAILAHELRNPLAPIRTAVRVLREPQVPAPLAARSREIIERQVGIMSRLIDALLDVSRLSRGVMHLEKDRVRLDHVLDVAFETARPWLHERRHDVDQRRLRREVWVEGDLARLSQAFANLLHNAAKFTAPGGRIRLEVQERPGGVAVSVTDNGPGIAPEHIDGIFELFTQVPGETSATGGLGIGLTLARRFVELHGGTITATSSGEGVGATFTVTLPAAAITEPDGEPVATPSTPVRVQRRVLVADDNADAAETTATLLANAGCRVRTVFSGHDAIAATADFHPEVVLLDLGMPDLSGLDTCARLRHAPGGRDLFIAAITGWGQDEDRRRTQSAGFDAHLVKPVAPDDLLQVIATARRPGGS